MIVRDHGAADIPECAQSSQCVCSPNNLSPCDLQYKPTGVRRKGTCVTREKKNCGNLNQQSCGTSTRPGGAAETSSTSLQGFPDKAPAF
jgi:hypothetical protein